MTGDAPILLRAAEAQDATVLIDLLRRSWLRTWAPELPFAAVRRFVDQDPVTDYVKENQSDFMLAVRARAIVGLLHVVDDRIESIEADPKLLRTGIGTVLLAHAEAEIARSHPIARLEVRAFNHRALAFYDRHGWTEAARFVAIECGAPVDTIALAKPVGYTPALAGA